MNRRIALKTIGCRTNQQEETRLRIQLMRSGYLIEEQPGEADVIIINTCCVTAHSEAKTRRMISAMARNAPNAQILLTGCFAQQKPEQLKKISSVRWVVGNSHKHSIPKILRSGEGGVFHGDPLSVIEPLSRSNIPLSAAVRLTRYPVKIQEGCDFRCSYCIVPSVRGPSRSADHAAILEEIRCAVGAGFKEIILTGTHIGQYAGIPNVDLARLLGSIGEMEGDFRIRLSSLDPRDLNEEILALVSGNPRLCRHLHISIQSLDQRVLERMHRPAHGLEQVIGWLHLLRSRHPHISLGGDFIVGFPGESIDEFENTLALTRETGFTYGHVFRFSSRPGTPASRMGPPVDEKEKKRRAGELSAALEEANRRFVEGLAGKTERIIVEQTGPVRGTTSNYLQAEIPGIEAVRNTWLDISFNGVMQPRGRCCLATIPGSGGTHVPC